MKKLFIVGGMALGFLGLMHLASIGPPGPGVAVASGGSQNDLALCQAPSRVDLSIACANDIADLVINAYDRMGLMRPGPAIIGEFRAAMLDTREPGGARAPTFAISNRLPYDYGVEFADLRAITHYMNVLRAIARCALAPGHVLRC